MISIAKAKKLRQNANVKAFLNMIGFSEGADYRTLVHGGRNNQLIKSLAKHPNVIKKTSTGRLPSTAAGKYQFLFGTWKQFRNGLGLKDFSEESQDLACIAQLWEKDAIAPILKGDIATSISKTRKVWASFPGARYGQGENALSTLLKFYKENATSVPVVAGFGFTTGIAVAVLVFF
jgi:muramidase (phage lysozyme)